MEVRKLDTNLPSVCRYSNIPHTYNFWTIKKKQNTLYF